MSTKPEPKSDNGAAGYTQGAASSGGANSVTPSQHAKVLEPATRSNESE
jgi:hypothetical protein